MALRQSTTSLLSSTSSRLLLSSRSPLICSSCSTLPRSRRYASTEATATTASDSPIEPPSTAAEPTSPKARSPRIPSPTPFVPDTTTFLKLIGRSLSTHASKFTSWDEMFTLTSPQLAARGLEPARTRRYFLRWRQKFRDGDFGIGGDLKYVDENGTAELRVCEVPCLPGKEAPPSTTHTPGFTKLILNVPRGATTYALEQGQGTADLKKPKGFKLIDGRRIKGRWTNPMKGYYGEVVTISAVEGMWEHKRGRKVFGGERRRAETLHKMRVAENKKARR
jgi:hypothetical protein